MSNQEPTQPETKPEPPAVAPAKPPKEIRVVVDSGPMGGVLDTARWEQAQRVANGISASPLIPAHLRGDKHRDYSYEEIRANVLLVITQAFLWEVHPSSVIAESYVVGGRLGYQGKLVAALVNAKAPLKERLRKSYTGQPGSDNFTITVTGTFIGEDEPRETSLSVGEARTDNFMWKKNPRLKLWYSGVIQWAREYCPELVLGIVTDDDADRMDSWKAEAAKALPSRPARTEKPNFAPPPPAEEEKPAKAKRPRGTGLHAPAVDKCDGKHGSPPCDDPECWLRAPHPAPPAPPAEEGTPKPSDEFPFEEGQ
jgi:hypothetical protein